MGLANTTFGYLYLQKRIPQVILSGGKESGNFWGMRAKENPNCFCMIFPVLFHKFSHLRICVHVNTHYHVYLNSYFINSTGDYCRCVEKSFQDFWDWTFTCSLFITVLFSSKWKKVTKKYALWIFEESFKCILTISKSLSPKVQTDMIWNKFLPAVFVGRKSESRNRFLVDVN